MRRVWIVLFLLMVFAAGCRGASPQPGKTEDVPMASSGTEAPSSSAATDTPAPTATATQSPSPTVTAEVTDTPMPTETPVPTEVPWVDGVIIAEVLKIYLGPGTVYDSIGALGKGVHLRMVAVEPDFGWAVIDLGFEQRGWVNLNGVDWEGGLTALPLAKVPPTPTPSPTLPPAPKISYTINGAGLFIHDSSGFVPGEKVIATLTFLDNGKVVATANKYVNDEGRLGAWNVKAVLVDQGTYLFVISGDMGSYIQFTFTFER